MGLEINRNVINLQDESSTLDLGHALVSQIKSGMVYLHGALGAGKTTFVRGFLKGLGYQGLVKSPTYTLIEPYQIGQMSVAHLDLYRVKDPLELEFIGIDELIEDMLLVFVEWPDRGVGKLPSPHWTIELIVKGEGRQACVTRMEESSHVSY